MTEKLKIDSKKTLNLIKERWIFLVILLIAIALRAKNFTAPCGNVGHLAHGCKFYSGIMQNYIECGFLNTKFGPVVGVVNGNFNYYVHHSSMIFYLLLGLSFKIFNSIWSLRIIPLLFSSGSVVLIYLLGKEMESKRVALFAMFLFALAPIAALYGSHIDVLGPIPLFFILFISLFYYKWQKNNFERKYYSVMIISFVIGTQSDWPVYFLVPAFIFHHLLTCKKPKKEVWLLFPLIAVFSLFLYLLYIRFLTGSLMGEESYQGSLLWASKVRASSIASDINHSRLFNFSQFISKVWFHLRPMYTPILLILSGIWLIVFFINIFKKGGGKQNLFLMSLFLMGFISTIIFKQAAYIHEYWYVIFLPFFVLSSSIVLDQIIKKFSKRISLIIIFLVLVTFSIYSLNVILSRYLEVYGGDPGLDYNLIKFIWRFIFENPIKELKECVTLPAGRVGLFDLLP